MMNDHQRIWGEACYPVVDLNAALRSPTKSKDFYRYSLVSDSRILSQWVCCLQKYTAMPYNQKCSALLKLDCSHDLFRNI
jgi:hypothetical protein